jgi:hypothetical protein
MKKVVFTFGRMNPPTIGHEKLVKKVQDAARSNGADARVYLSHTSVQTDPKNKKDPLNYRQKIKYATKAFGSIIQESDAKTLIAILKELEQSGYTDIVAVFGGDRVKEMETLIKKYNGKDYNFESISMVNAGDRDPDSTDPSTKKKKKHVTKVSEMSASALRALAAEGQMDDYEEDGKKYIGFRKGLPKKLQGDAEKVMKDVQSNLSEEVELDERAPLTISQRQAKARQMKRLAPKLARLRKMKAKRKADETTIKQRAQKKAIQIIRQKVAGDRGGDYKKLSGSEKISIDKLVQKKSAVIQKLAKKLLPKVRQAEQERLKQARTAKTEDFDINELFDEVMLNDLFEAKVAQDPDIKDREGTQPKKYHSGLSKSTKAKRDAEFKKGAEKDSDDPSAYPDKHAGDAGAETKTSKHTKKYHDMFGEQNFVRGPNTQRVKDNIKREKEQDKNRHDSMLDRARVADARLKNAKTEEYELSEDATAALQKKADKSGISLGILRQVYNRGMAAWKTGHRPGATQQQWAFARVNSFLTGGKTRTTADADLWAKAKGRKEEVELDESKYGFFGTHNPKIGDKVKHKSGATGTVKSLTTQGNNTDVNFKLDKDVKIFGIPHKKGQTVSFGAKYLTVVKEEASSPEQQAAIAISKKKKKLNAMLGVPAARPVVPMGEETLEEMPRWLLEPISKVTHKKGYDAAKKVLADVLARKAKEAGGMKKLQHDPVYYAAQIAKQFDGVDARTLVKMVEEGGAGQYGTDELTKKYKKDTPMAESYVFAKDEYKMRGTFEHHPTTDFQEEYLGWDDDLVEETEYQGRKVKLNDPFRSNDGKKKFYVYVKNEKGNVIKLGFGDPDMEIKRDDPKRRANYRARHGCDNPGPKWKANYWSCKMWAKTPVSKLD